MPFVNRVVLHPAGLVKHAVLDAYFEAVSSGAIRAITQYLNGLVQPQTSFQATRDWAVEIYRQEYDEDGMPTDTKLIGRVGTVGDSTWYYFDPEEIGLQYSSIFRADPHSGAAREVLHAADEEVS